MNQTFCTKPEFRTSMQTELTIEMKIYKFTNLQIYKMSNNAEYIDNVKTLSTGTMTLTN